ncbi:uncharacterized protein LOC126741176 isoform X2 [Anthonomus grandis grandis]|uniref:uncharacterized protein LOC126741176 isoform X2 n=1 Tax=Anthonomus grandis grandis TaxID=2921223 RepID=UPI002166B143|nr:uncharacterized protein LOC126741176 isoform X2 [Anthonomus grandis grandis]
MSICSQMTGCDSHASGSAEATREQLLNIQNELVWGMAYRHYKEKEKKKPMAPMHSPIDIPFELCRAEMLLGHVPTDRLRQTLDEADRGDGEKGGKDETKPKKKKRKIQQQREEKPSLLDRNVWPQNKYMDYLSRPNPKFYDEPKTKKYKKRCELEPCPPRFIQLAVPNKRRVFANWKEYEHFLPAEMLMRFDDILHTDQNLDPREARYYYKKLDKEKRKALRAKRRLAKKKRLEKENDSNWMKSEIDILAKLILDYIKDEPLFTLNYKQLLLSDGILDRLEHTKSLKKPSRTSKKHFQKTVIETSDKLAVWIDTLTRFVDVQAIESEEDIPPVSIPSLSEEGEESEEEESEESEEYELSSDEEGSAAGPWVAGGEDEIDWEEPGVEDEKPSRPEDHEGEVGMFGEDGESEGDLGELDQDLLEKLIKILSNCPEEFLEGHIDDEKTPGVKYIDVLNKLKELRDELTTEGPRKPFLEQIMLDWAIRNEPDKVDDPMVEKIRQVACMLGDWLGTKRPGEGPGDVTPGEEGDISGEEGDDQAEEGEAGKEEGEEEPVAGDDEGGEGAGVGDDEGGEGAGVGEEEDGEGPGVGDEGGVEEPGLSGEEGEEGAGEEGEQEAPGGGDAAEEGEDEGESGGYEYPTPGGEEEGEGGIGSSKETLPGYEGEEPGIEEYPSIPGEEGATEDEFEFEMEEGGEGEIIYPPGGAKPGVPALDGRWIKGHKPSKVFEHSPDTVCCLSLKTWAVWLLEITHNAHNWTQWYRLF